jgi:hypothetical protein
MGKNTQYLTNHARERLCGRNIPEALIDETIKNGTRCINLSRNAYEYRLKNVLGLKGQNLVVLQSFNGAILTSYVERIPRKH